MLIIAEPNNSVHTNCRKFILIELNLIDLYCNLV